MNTNRVGCVNLVENLEDLLHCLETLAREQDFVPTQYKSFSCDPYHFTFHQSFSIPENKLPNFICIS